jgi:hypothetical protein
MAGFLRIVRINIGELTMRGNDATLPQRLQCLFDKLTTNVASQATVGNVLRALPPAFTIIDRF